MCFSVFTFGGIQFLNMVFVLTKNAIYTQQIKDNASQPLITQKLCRQHSITRNYVFQLNSFAAKTTHGKLLSQVTLNKSCLHVLIPLTCLETNLQTVL